MRLTALVVAVLTLLASSISQSVSAKDFTGNVLHDLCTGSDQRGQDACRMWISGFSDGMFAAQAYARGKNLVPVSCIPNGFTGDQARLIIEKFMRDHPNTLHNIAQAIAFFALTEAFPCKK